MEEEEIDLRPYYESFKKTSVFALLSKSGIVLKRFWGLLLLITAVTAGISYYFEISKKAVYETTLLIKSNQLNSNISEFIINDVFNSSNSSQIPGRDSLISIEVSDGEANLELLKQIEATSMVYPLELSEWLIFQDYMSVRILSTRKIDQRQTSFIIDLLENNSYMQHMKGKQEVALLEKIEIVEERLEDLKADEEVSIAEETKLKLKLVDLQYSLKGLASARLIYQTQPKEVQVVDWRLIAEHSAMALALLFFILLLATKRK